MKNFLYQASIMSSVFLLVSCSSPESDAIAGSSTVEEKPTTEAFSNIPKYEATAKDTISLNTFQEWTDNWSKYSRAWMDTTTLTYFNMPLVDLTQAVGEKGVASTRFYMGLEVDKKGYLPKLCLVGVDSSGNNMTDASKGQYVYDLSRPCPPFCKD